MLSYFLFHHTVLSYIILIYPILKIPTSLMLSYLNFSVSVFSYIVLSYLFYLVLIERFQKIVILSYLI